MRRLFRELPFILLSAAAVAMAGVLVLVMSGRFVSDPSAEPERTAAAPKPRTGTTAAPASAAKTTTRIVKTRTADAETHAKTRMTVTATRGDSWMEVRRSSATGEVLFSGILRKGESHAFSSRRLWLRLGAAGNVDVVVDGKEQPVPSGTPELTLPA